MLEIKCDKCGNELEMPGALIFSPPSKDRCVKFHICTSCWNEVENLLDTKKNG